MAYNIGSIFFKNSLKHVGLHNVYTMYYMHGCSQITSYQSLPLCLGFSKNYNNIYIYENKNPLSGRGLAVLDALALCNTRVSPCSVRLSPYD